MPGSPYTDLERPPLHEAALRRALVAPASLYTEVRVVAETASTNADVASAARGGAPEGLVVIAERQTHGRGRMDREWISPARAGLAVSLLLRPGDHEVAVERYGWLPLLAGVALVDAVARVTGLNAELKWPNDLLIDQRKCAGILAESVPAGGQPPAVVLGIGLNVSLRADELPNPDATSLLLSGAKTADRDPLVRALLRAVEQWYRTWTGVAGDAGSSGLLAAYRGCCATIGRQVRVDMPGGSALVAEAVDVDGAGRLMLVGPNGAQSVAAGDVVHLR